MLKLRLGTCFAGLLIYQPSQIEDFRYFIKGAHEFEWTMLMCNLWAPQGGWQQRLKSHAGVGKTSQVSGPVFNNTIPVTSGRFRLLKRMPLNTCTPIHDTLEYRILYMFSRPKPAATFAISWHDESTIRGEVDFKSIASYSMSCKTLPSIQLKMLWSTVDKDPIV